MALVEGGLMGPSAVAARVETSPSTAHRDLRGLERYKLVLQDHDLAPGQYAVTWKGQEEVERIVNVHGPAFYEALSTMLDKQVSERVQKEVEEIFGPESKNPRTKPKSNKQSNAEEES